MRIPGKTMDDHLADVSRQLPEGSCVDMQDVEANADIYPSQVFLEYRTGFDRDNPHRPYMHIMGECRAIRRADGQKLYGDVDQLDFDEGDGIPVDIFYEFSDDELADMVKKGMYRRGFECPDIIRESSLEIPVYCELRVVEPQAEDDVPIVFANIEDRHTVRMDAVTSGYTLGDYFESPKVREDDIEDDFDAFDDYGEFEDEDDLFYEGDKSDQVEMPEHTADMTPEQQALEEHYQHVYQRVQEDHLERKPEPAFGKQPERPTLEHDVPQAFVDKAVEEPVAEHLEKGASVEHTADVADAVSDERTTETVEPETAVDDEFVDFDDEETGAGVSEQVAEDNVIANAADEPEAQGLVDEDDGGEPDDETKSDEHVTPRTVPAHLEAVAEKAAHGVEAEDQQFDE